MFAYIAMKDFALRIQFILRQCSKVMDDMVSAVNHVSTEFDLMALGVWESHCPLAGSIVAVKES